MFEPWQMREMRPCPRQIREICSCARAAAGLEGAAGAGRGPAQNTLQTTQSQWLRPASIAGQSVHERARSAPRKIGAYVHFREIFDPLVQMREILRPEQIREISGQCHPHTTHPGILSAAWADWDSRVHTSHDALT